MDYFIQIACKNWIGTSCFNAAPSQEKNVIDENNTFKGKDEWEWLYLSVDTCNCQYEFMIIQIIKINYLQYTLYNLFVT